jgi:threonine dehydratase
MSVSIDDIRRAADLIARDVVRTPTIRSGPLSDLLDADVYLKLEILQRTGSFKDRGALVKLDSLTADEKKRGVIAVSAGNHAQGVAYHAQRLGIPATIVMPEGTPFTKVRRTQAFGARVELRGDNVNAVEPFALERAARDRLVFVHPYNDEKIIAGQGTAGLEILEDVPRLDAIVVPIGGGGFISGIATATKAIAPEIDIIGVEADLYPSVYNALHGIEAPLGGASIAEGIAIKSPGDITLDIVRRLVDDIIVVTESAIEAAVQTMLIQAKVLAEGAGAAPLAALLEHRGRFAGTTVCLLVSGANIDARILSSVLMRGMARAGHIARLRVTIDDRPGVLAKVAAEIGEAGGNIVEIHHQRMFYDIPLKFAELDTVVETRDSDHAAEIMRRLEALGFPTRQTPHTRSGR